MKRDSSGFIWGVILIVIGLFIAGKQFNLFDFTVFFKGWWTLFIIIPCFIGLFNNDQGRMSYVVGLCIGILLLLSAQDIVKWSMFGPLFFAFILIFAGVNIMFKKDHHGKYQDYYTNDYNSSNQTGSYREYQRSNMNFSDSENDFEENSSNNNNMNDDSNSNYNDSNSNYNDSNSNYNDSNSNYNDSNGNYNDSNGNSNGSFNYNNGNSSYNNGNGSYSYTYNNNQSNQYSNGSNYHNPNQGQYRGNSSCVCTAIFSGKELRFDNQEFKGAVLSAVFGGIDLNLRNAVIRENVVIDARTVLGGIDIYVPDYVRVVVDCTPILGGVDNNSKTPMGADASTPVIFINATCVLGGIDVK